MINHNGNLVSKEQAKLLITNRGFQYGDSLFESIRVINSSIMFWEDHYFRLMSSMRILRMEIPANFSPEYLEEKIKELVEANRFSKTACRVKINVYRDAEGKYLPKSNQIGYLISADEIEEQFFTLKEQKCEVELFKDHFVIDGLLSTLKSNNQLVPILASIFAEENDYDNCLLLNQKKMVVETTNGNLFLVKKNKIKTPPLSDGCLNGIIRKQLLDIITKMDGYELVEESISPFELQKADELFYTNAIQGIVNITKYRKKEYQSTTAKKLVGQLNARARLA